MCLVALVILFQQGQQIPYQELYLITAHSGGIVMDAQVDSLYLLNNMNLKRRQHQAGIAVAHCQYVQIRCLCTIHIKPVIVHQGHGGPGLTQVMRQLFRHG